MQLVSFEHRGLPSYGLVAHDRVIDLGRRFGPQAPTLLKAIEGGLIGPGLESLRADGRDPQLADIRFQLPIVEPTTIICVGRNYGGHIAEAGLKMPDFPSLFIRTRSSLVAHGEALVRPAISHSFDFEGELALVIGKGGRDIQVADAMDHVFGYACFNDGSLRDFQFNHSLTVGKNFWRSGGFGPCVTPAFAVGDPSDLEVRTILNGTEMQHGHLGDLLFDIAYLIAYVSRFTVLCPGDVIATGTPDGVGFARTPPVWLKPGDEIVVSIAGVGELRNGVEEIAS